VKTQRNTFEADWAEWHRRHEERRADPHGFLAITGRHWLTPEPQRFGDVPGAWSAAGDTVTVTLDDDEDLAVDGEPVHGTYTFAPIPERGQVTPTSGDAAIEVARRGGHMIVSLEVAAPAADGTVILDFNHAVNLPCAYTEFATCPLPPPGNHLPVAITAGEKTPS
jgi:uncharacterized protein (DUF1684 family)